MSMGRCLLVLPLIFTQFGCSWNLSNAPPYKPLIGTEVTLLEEMELRQDTRYLGSPSVLCKPLGPDPISSTDKRLAELPAGTQVHITAIKGTHGLMNGSVNAY